MKTRILSSVKEGSQRSSHVSYTDLRICFNSGWLSKKLAKNILPASADIIAIDFSSNAETPGKAVTFEATLKCMMRFPCKEIFHQTFNATLSYCNVHRVVCQFVTHGYCD